MDRTPYWHTIYENLPVWNRKYIEWRDGGNCCKGGSPLRKFCLLSRLPDRIQSKDATGPGADDAEGNRGDEEGPETPENRFGISTRRDNSLGTTAAWSQKG